MDERRRRVDLGGERRGEQQDEEREPDLETQEKSLLRNTLQGWRSGRGGRPGSLECPSTRKRRKKGLTA